MLQINVSGPAKADTEKGGVELDFGDASFPARFYIFGRTRMKYHRRVDGHHSIISHRPKLLCA